MRGYTRTQAFPRVDDGIPRKRRSVGAKPGKGMPIPALCAHWTRIVSARWSLPVGGWRKTSAMRDPFDDGAADGWVPLPPGTVLNTTRAITRRAHEETWAWFPIPDPNGYAGVALFLRGEGSAVREFWLWNEASEDRAVRIVRLGSRRFVVELRDSETNGILVDPARITIATPVSDEERDVLGHDAVSPAQTFSSPFLAESCARVWLNHGQVHDGCVLEARGDS